MPEIPLSVGSKLELLRAFCLCQLSVYFPVHSRICPRMHNIAVYITMYMTEAPRVLHFSAFITCMNEGTKVQNPQRPLSCAMYYS